MFTLLKLVVVVVLVVACAVLAFSILGFLAGIVWTAVKIVVIGAVIYIVAKMVLGNKSSTSE